MDSGSPVPSITRSKFSSSSSFDAEVSIVIVVDDRRDKCGGQSKKERKRDEL